MALYMRIDELAPDLQCGVGSSLILISQTAIELPEWILK